ncbi:glutaminase [Fulvivirga kasyanovii]|uniref:Glutaminase n=1 Tax=Fulvivirga kasyanovii TaxID=396812 RepID=A0ABW9RR63_9BACT|nr:glutaminase [Fulvivirga kasyanovii]MTI26679.1 glutaminase [Fulvivirga kasyanovii]
MDYQKILEEIHQEVLPLLDKGKVADYIPELANVDASKFGIHLLTLEDNAYSVGDVHEKFSIQSISKVFMLALTISHLGEKVYERVDVEPSGDPFNSLVQLEHECGIPRNPFINSGALVITDMMISSFEDPRTEFLEYVRDLVGHSEIFCNMKVAASEKQHGFKNAAMVNLMKSFGNIENDVEDVLDLYFEFCSIEMTCSELAKAFRVFANHGRGVIDTKKYITESQFKRITAIMQTCGFYDEAGEFAFRVGLPGKSGVGGGIAAILPDEYSIVTWSPGLNKKGNSLAGMKALELFTTKTGTSIF